MFRHNCSVVSGSLRSAAGVGRCGLCSSTGHLWFKPLQAILQSRLYWRSQHFIMGVQGLLTHCLKNKEQCVEFVDLVEVARQHHGIDILVDFYSFQQLFISKLWESLTAQTGNPYLRLAGGEYETLDARLTKLVTDLRSLNIHLVMYVDGGKGTSKKGTQQKMETWKKRHHNDMGKLRELLDVCEGRKGIENVSKDTNVRPVLLEVQVFETLKKCNCEVVSLSSGEADFVIARGLLNRPRAYAVLSNDTDFCIFRASMFIPNDLFDLENDLQLNGDQRLPDKPLRLMAGVISSMRVAKMLGFDNPNLLIEMSIIAGNDFTGPHLYSMKPQLGLKGARISQIADWVLKNQTVENDSQVRHLMHTNKSFCEAVKKSREFYSVIKPDTSEESLGFLTHMIKQGVEDGRYPSNVMAMHHNFYWHRMLLEDCRQGYPCAECAMADLRSRLYRIILSEEDRAVVEYGREPYNQFSNGPVHKVQGHQVRIPALNCIDKDKIFQNLWTFRYIMLHQEPYFQHDFFKRYGRKNGFICFVLRYFLVLNVDRNLNLNMGEFMAVLAVAFGKVDPSWYQGLALCPNARCVTVGNWFQDVYRYAYQFLGKLLCLTHEFPAPQEIFSGAVYTSFYMLTCNEGKIHRWLEPDAAIHIRQGMDQVIKDKRHMIRYLVEGIFEFNPRF